MPPIFPPRSNLFARLSILGALVLLAAVAGFLVWWTHSPTFNKVGVTVPQPVPFPHSMHVAVVGIDCRYCHDSVDKSSFANLPPTETCMSCHSQIKTERALLAPVRDSWSNGTPIEWNRVNQLPDYVFFDHQIHVKKGVGCETCHGRLDQVATAVKAETFYMAWCLDCHRNPEQYIRPVENVYDVGYKPAEDQKVLGARLIEEYGIMSSSQLMDCSICHR
jgi:hypothetical protein